jgi:hypothetical protein
MGTNPMAKAKAEPTPRQKGCGCLTLLVVVAVIAVIVATAGSTSNGPKLPAHVASSQIGQWVTALMGAPSDGIPRVESVQCSASECSIQVHVSAKDVSGSLTEKQLAYPAFRVVFRDPGITVASVTLYGPTDSRPERQHVQHRRLQRDRDVRRASPRELCPAELGRHRRAAR